jgi:tRNA G10  N-methylase Trm11
VPKGKTILDPFCGIGTILQEGVLMGYKVLGSDISATAIDGSEKNLEWFRNRYQVAPGKYRLETCDVAKVSEVFRGDKIAAVVTEGWLGPIYFNVPKPAQMERNFADLKVLWLSAMGQFAKVLESGSRVVVCLPAYKVGLVNYEFMPGIDDLLALGYTIEDPFPESVYKVAPFLKVTARKSMIYDRKEQVVAREIITFIKQ